MSTPKSCVGGRARSSKRRKNRTRRKIHKKRAVSSSRLSDGSHLPSFTNPTFQGLSLSLDLVLDFTFYDQFSFMGLCISLLPISKA